MKRLAAPSARTVALLAAALLSTSACDPGPPMLGRTAVAELVDSMTVEEKATLLVGMGFRRGNAPASLPPVRVPGAAGRTYPIARLGIPSMTLADGPAGLRIAPERESAPGETFYATAFPVATMLASTWDTALVRRVGEAMGAEVRDYGVDILLAPGMNLHRNPLGGRNFEYYSEDPFVTGTMAAAFVNGVESRGVGTAIKHFVANNQEFNRHSSDTRVTERTLRELYLKGFEIAVRDAQPWTVMSSYNLVNGTYTPQAHELLTGILRDEWGFDGFVMTDWGGGDDPVAAMAAGNDVIMPGNPGQIRAIVDAVADGTLPESRLDANVARVLEVILRSPTFRDVEYGNAPDLEGHARIARDAAAQGMVLLKNDDGALPLEPGPVALFGNPAYRLITGGGGSGDVNEAYSIPVVQGLEDAGFTVASDLAQAYEAYLTEAEASRDEGQGMFRRPPPIPERRVGADEIRDAAASADAGIVVIGRNSSEGGDRPLEGNFLLTDQERSLIRRVAAAFRTEGKPAVVVLNIPSPVEVASWRQAPAAILLAWQPGQEGGRAVADVLGGSVNPSGRLTSTFPVAWDDVPSSANFPGELVPGQDEDGRAARVTYEEGVYVGYRYHETFGLEPAYAFGHGLSYTGFEYGGLALQMASLADGIRASVEVTNTGGVAGREVVQLYVEPPAGPVDRPVRELKGFARTRLLQPGETQTVEVAVNPADLAYYDEGRSAWVADGGTYTVAVGASSRDIRQRATFDAPEGRVVQQVENRVVPEVEIEELEAGSR